MINLEEIYTPLFEHIVIEFNIPGKTKGGVILPDAVRKEEARKQSPAVRVVAIGEDVKNLAVGDYILTNDSPRITQVPLLYKDAKEGTQHGQIHVSEVMGIIDADFAKNIKSDDSSDAGTKEKIVN